MTFSFIARHAKTTVLTVLVLASFVLSYLLWNGNWQNATEVGLTSTNVLQTSNYPRAAEALTPYRIVLTSMKTNKASETVPLDSAYQSWMSMLGITHITNLHMVASIPPRLFTKAEFDFSSNVERTTLLTWLPNLSSAIIPAEGRIISLYTVSEAGPVYVAIQEGTVTYVGQTDLGALDFNQSAISTIRKSPWVAWDGKNGDYVPAANQTMNRFTWKISKLPPLPIVHSFFVNPQILTRIQENPNTVLWTDGSRAVEWDEPNHSLTFEDPNLTDKIQNAGSDLDTAMSFIRNHGGSPQNVIAFQSENQSGFGDATAYTFSPLVNGYPIYGQEFAYTIEVYQGHILQYERPLIEYGEHGAVKTVRFLAPSTLRAIIVKSIGAVKAASVQVKLGYYPVIGHTAVTFIPSYFVYNDSTLVQIVDASSGEILPKGGQS